MSCIIVNYWMFLPSFLQKIFPASATKINFQKFKIQWKKSHNFFSFSTYTSLLDVCTFSNSASGAIHFKGSFPMLLALWYSKLSYTSRVNPKSDILTRLSSQTKMLRAARSRCTNFFCDKYSCTMKQYGLDSLIEKRLFSSSFPGFLFIYFFLTLSFQIVYFCLFLMRIQKFLVTMPTAICRAKEINSFWPSSLRLSSLMFSLVSALLQMFPVRWRRNGVSETSRHSHNNY